MILEEDDFNEFESNFSSMGSYQRKEAEKLSCSDWDDSKLGGSQSGYNMAGIRWSDLGRKYMIKKGKKSMIAHADESIYPYDVARYSNTAGVIDVASEGFNSMEPQRLL